MLWEIEILPRGDDPERARVAQEYDLLTHTGDGQRLVRTTARGYLLEGNLSADEAGVLARELLVDDLVESSRVSELGAPRPADGVGTVLYRPGVMDPVALSVVEAAHDLGIQVEAVRTFRRYYFAGEPGEAARAVLHRVLANDAIEQVVTGPLRLEHLSLGTPYSFALKTIPIRELDDTSLLEVSRRGQLALSLAEMRTVQAHFREQGREPTDVELETIAQTWSEHCSHKTLRGTIDFQ